MPVSAICGKKNVATLSCGRKVCSFNPGLFFAPMETSFCTFIRADCMKLSFVCGIFFDGMASRASIVASPRCLGFYGRRMPQPSLRGGRLWQSNRPREVMRLSWNGPSLHVCFVGVGLSRLPHCYGCCKGSSPLQTCLRVPSHACLPVILENKNEGF